jgi:hypothetical protein
MMADILDDIREEVILVPEELKNRFLKELVVSYLLYFALWNYFQSEAWDLIHNIMCYPILHGIFTTLCGFISLSILRLRVLHIKKDLDKISLGIVLRNIGFALSFSLLIGLMLMIAAVMIRMFLHDLATEIPNYIFVTGQLTLIGIGIYYFVFTMADDLIK